MIALDASSHGSDSTSALSFAHTVAGSSRVLFVLVAVRSSSIGVNAVSYGGVGLSRQATALKQGFTLEIWQMIAPPTGTNNIVVSVDSSTQVAAYGVSFTGVDQNLPLENTASANSSTLTPSQAIITSTANAWVLDFFAHESGTLKAAGAGQTLISRNVETGSSWDTGASYETTTTSGSVTMNWTGASDAWHQMAMVLVPSGAADAPTATLNIIESLYTADVRDVRHNLQVSWKKDNLLLGRTFTIGVSLIGGNDIIGANPGAIGSPGNYRYFDESDYAMSLAWEQGLTIPTGGLKTGLAEGLLDNTSGRFTPRYVGGSSELYTSILPRRPFIINAGFNDGTDRLLSQFAGIFNRQPEVDKRDRQIRFSGADYTDFLYNRYLDQEVMFTGLRTDQVMETLLGSLGLNTAQYDLDYGINFIPFGLFDKGTRYSQIFHQLAEAEDAHFYQDEEGIFRFENRQHWDNSPHNVVSRIISTAEVIEANVPDDDHIINVVEIKAPIIQKQPLQTIFNLPALSSIAISAGETVDKFFEFQDPVLALTEPTSGGANSYYLANTSSDGSGTDMTSNVSVTNVGTFAKSVKYRFRNSAAQAVFITQFVLAGRVARQIGDLYYRERDDSSVTAYEERPLLVENEYIQNESWAASYARLILNDFSEPENLQKITIMANPNTKLGDLVSWQGRYWRVFDKKHKLSAGEGFVQELTLLQRTIQAYFRIGISTIGGSDPIAP